VLRIPQYREAFQRAAEQARERLDPRQVAADIDRLAERSTSAERPHGFAGAQRRKS
jgi:hypothetical protein